MSQQTASDAQGLEELLQKRRSIRLFNGQPVPDYVTRRALELALLSPSSSNLQPWRFYRLQNPSPEARACFLNQAPAKTCPEIIVAVARPDLWSSTNDKIIAFLQEKKPPHFDYLMNYHGRLTPFSHDRGFLGLKGRIRASIIWLFGLLRPVCRQGFSKNSLREIAVKSTALACQTFMLAMAEQDYDSCPMEGFDHKRLRKLLKLPRAAVPVMGIAIGKRNPTYAPPARMRFEYDETVIDV
ncbi:MAG TPA: nitroreductase family protein [Alphaproteobacteria bacterium]|nr:nitroreductase family protein [Alphaproteobacteria bacterium]